MNVSTDSLDTFIQFENNSCPEIWQSNVDSVETTIANGVGQEIFILEIYLKSPLYISLNELTPKPIYKLYVGTNPDIELMPLLGLDVSEQYEYHSVRIRGKKQLILEEENNYDSW